MQNVITLYRTDYISLKWHNESKRIYVFYFLIMKNGRNIRNVIIGGTHAKSPNICKVV